MSVTASVIAALEAAGIAAAKGGASASGGGLIKFLWRKASCGEAKAAKNVVAMAIIRTIEETTPDSDQRGVAWWTRAGQQLIKPFIDKQVANAVLNAVIANPRNTEGTRATLVFALEATGHNFAELADDLKFDTEQFLAAIPSVLFDELMTAAAEPNSSLLTRAQFATLRQIAPETADDSAACEPGAALADLVELDAEDGLPTVAELDPYQLGATPSHFGSTGNYGQSDPYVPRARDNDLATALTGAVELNRMVLLVGPSKAGKTRTAFEAIRKHSPKARLLFPRPGMWSRLLVDPRLGCSGDSIIVWLDDLDRYLASPNPLTPTLLLQLTRRYDSVVVLATLRQEQRERLHQGGELTRDTRALLEHAVTINLAPLTSDDSRECAAANSAYPGQDLKFGLAAHLAGAPELLKRYRDAQHSDPLRYLSICAAIDWARTGRPDPIPEDSLIRLALEAFESERPDLDIRDRGAADAIKDARTPPEGLGRVAALTTYRLPDRSRGYRPFDYLVAADDGQDGTPRPIPDYFWERVLKDAEPGIALTVGVSAFLRSNIPVAVDALKRPADYGDTPAMLALAELLADHQKPPDLASARKWYEKAAAAGNTDAMVNLGVLLAERSDPPDLASARQWYEKAAAAGDTDAMSNLGVSFEDHQDPPDRVAARQWYEKAAAAGHTGAMVNLGILLFDQGDLTGAHHWYEKASAAGHIVAMVNLGMLLAGQDPPDLGAARQWYEKAAAAGHTGAMVNLGILLFDQGDLTGAHHWYEKASAAGHTGAMVNLGMLLATQWDPPNLNDARHWWEKAATAGNVDSMANLGLLLSKQLNPPDLVGARDWYEKAFTAGHASIAVSLGHLLSELLDPPDLVGARDWYQKGADAGDAAAMNNLAALLVSRWDPPDLAAARHWWEKAANAGHVGARKNLATVFGEA